ncbi:hypothetical protein LTR56_014808 [Elasticomyces elasticus]|nr:hypothetical protein LTR56_014808 [Elasticomyces elasticus]KAK3644732.1 hypothetical protein LTR22_015107 [Elasticomyces elasticus]KAK4916117.1 hypothetical protein LTR49_015891 [Elasticomyces elasticus]KAK5755143.1 hypothetical protein LTS12_014707 [Elasticomyces elasticus]
MSSQPDQHLPEEQPEAEQTDAGNDLAMLKQRGVAMDTAFKAMERTLMHVHETTAGPGPNSAMEPEVYQLWTQLRAQLSQAKTELAELNAWWYTSSNEQRLSHEEAWRV